MLSTKGIHVCSLCIVVCYI